MGVEMRWRDLLLVAVVVPLAAVAEEVSGFCPPGARFVITVDGDTLCTVPPAACKLPKIPICTDALRCTCESPQDARPCTVTIVYPVGRPAAARLVPMEPWCDAAGAELAIAVMQARLLGAP